MDRKVEFDRLVRQAADDLYSNLPVGSGGQMVSVLHALTRHKWVREKDLAKELNMNAKQLIPVLLFLQEERLIQRESVPKLTRRKGASRATAVTSGQWLTVAKEDIMKIDPDSYCCLDYTKVHDAVKLRMHTMSKNLKKELAIETTVQNYFWTSCNIRFSALEALDLTSSSDEYFHCKRCSKILETVGESSASKSKTLLESLENMKEKLRPLISIVEKLTGLDAPKFTTLKQWLEAATDGNETAVTITPMHSVQMTNAETFSSDDRPDPGKRLKAMPSWMIREGGLNLTDKQVDTIRASIQDLADVDEGKEKTCGRRLEYPHAETRIKRQVGMKSKRDDESEKR